MGKPPALVSERQQLVVAAFAAAQPRKPVRRNAVFEECVEFILDESRRLGPGAGHARRARCGVANARYAYGHRCASRLASHPASCAPPLISMIQRTRALLALLEDTRRGQSGHRAKRTRGSVPVAHNERTTRPCGLIAHDPSGDLSDNDEFKGDHVKTPRAARAKAIVMPASTDLCFPPADTIFEVGDLPKATLQVVDTSQDHVAGGPGTSPVNQGARRCVEEPAARSSVIGERVPTSNRSAQLAAGQGGSGGARLDAEFLEHVF
jgi:hypothetical protein